MLRTDLPVFAFCAGPLIVTGRFFERLYFFEKAAIIAHERAHIAERHQLHRLWWIVTFQWRCMETRCKDQEFAADRIAALGGHSFGLISFLNRVKPPASLPWHPSHEERISAIEGLMSCQ